MNLIRIGMRLMGMRLMGNFISLSSLRYELDFAVCSLRNISLQSIWKEEKNSNSYFLTGNTLGLLKIGTVEHGSPYMMLWAYSLSRLVSEA